MEAQKKKFKVYKAAKLTTKGAAFVDFTEGSSQDGSASARPATAAAGTAASRAAKPATRPATAASRIAPRKPAAKGAGGGDESSVALNENLAGVDDPIALSMQERVKAGGLSSQITEAVAKKSGIKVFRAPKHVLKAGNALITFVEGNDDSSSNLRAPAKQASHAASPSPIKKRASNVTSAPRSGLAGGLKPTRTAGAADVPVTSQLDGDLSEDPIAQSLACRIKLGGIEAKATDADVKKNSYPVFKAAKHPALKGSALVDIGAPPKAAAESVAASPAKVGVAKAKGLKPPTKVTGSKAASSSLAVKKVPSEATGPAVSADEDPIGASLKARLDAGGLST